MNATRHPSSLDTLESAHSPSCDHSMLGVETTNKNRPPAVISGGLAPITRTERSETMTHSRTHSRYDFVQRLFSRCWLSNEVSNIEDTQQRLQSGMAERLSRLFRKTAVFVHPGCDVGKTGAGRDSRRAFRARLGLDPSAQAGFDPPEGLSHEARLGHWPLHGHAVRAVAGPHDPRARPVRGSRGHQRGRRHARLDPRGVKGPRIDLVAHPRLYPPGCPRVHAHPPRTATHAGAPTVGVVDRVEHRGPARIVDHAKPVAPHGPAKHVGAQVPHVIVHWPARPPALARTRGPQVKSQHAVLVSVEHEHDEASGVPHARQRSATQPREHHPQRVTRERLVAPQGRR